MHSTFFLRGLLRHSRHFSRPAAPTFHAPSFVTLNPLRRPFWHAARSQRLEQAPPHRFLSTSPPSSSETGSSSASESEPTNKFLGRFDEVPLKDQRLSIQFTCTKCDTASKHTMSRVAFERGVVIIRCPGCQNNHLIADHLGWFEEDDTTIESVMAEKGDQIKETEDGGMESVVLDPKILEHFASPRERARARKLMKKRTRQLEEWRRQKLAEETAAKMPGSAGETASSGTDQSATASVTGSSKL